MPVCTKYVNAPCGNEATEVLWVRERGPWGGEWEPKPRCAEHPAVQDVRMLRHVPAAEWEILPVGAPAPSPDREDSR
jgi:hypothetical protein